ncbi:MAG: hypothetical protein HFJ41_03645 [Clostridia bacterium]|nr:hypothetical protein [Clostridia bacterium]
MIKVYRAIYRTDTIYAEGYIVMYDDITMEGVFALDYIYIYEYGNNSFCFLKTLSYFTQDQLLMRAIKPYEFYASKQIFSPPGKYFFFNNSDDVLSLEINEEITDPEDITMILMDIAKVRT